ncbi:putative ABC transporter [Janibacter sp. HTCC2649]|uniref:thiol reductant ABC exporter subunit CydD n=1 Tax=Janibacter sp. HTCC2649 TaxID=313589 RepID=UPI0000670ADF|nr:thiol reductant ABC exporter subunit CydD [Janibacter sp. HTCC2649]EAQ00830.1 putative ABC transporter [Janibacter sp. HTCC2649]
MKPFDPRLLRAVPAVRRPVAILAVVAALQGAAAIGLAVALARLVTDVVSQGNWQRSATWVVVAFLVRAGLGMLVERIGASTATAVSSALRRRLLARWVSSPAEGRPGVERASTLAAQGAHAVEPYAARFLPALVAGAVVPVLAVATLVVVDPLSAVIVVVTLPLLPLFAALIGRTTQDDTLSRWRALEQLAGHFGDVMRGLPTLVAYGRARRQVEVVKDVSEQHRLATMRTLRLAFMSSAALELLATISVAIVAVSVGLRLTHGSMTLQAGLLAILLAPEAYWPIRRVGAEFHAAADGATAIDDILTELKTPNLLPLSSNRARMAETIPALLDENVRAEGVGYAYPWAEGLVLDDVTLSAGTGLTVVTGESGAGKTTLLDLLAGVRTPSAGEIATGPVHYVTQRPFLPDGTIEEAVRLGTSPDLTEIDVWAALSRVGLDEFVAGLPDRLSTALGDDGFGLSAGQRLRLGLARAALSEAPVLLLDEPTAHLDHAGTDLVVTFIRTLARDRCVIAATHSSELVSVADEHLHLGHAMAVVGS